MLRRLLALVSAVVLVDVVFYSAIVPLLPAYTDDLGLSKSQAGALAGSYAAGTGLAAIPAGALARRVGPQRGKAFGRGKGRNLGGAPLVKTKNRPDRCP